jgi:hypothetical protein
MELFREEVGAENPGNAVLNRSKQRRMSTAGCAVSATSPSSLVTAALSSPRSRWPRRPVRRLPPVDPPAWCCLSHSSRNERAAGGISLLHFLIALVLSSTWGVAKETEQCNCSCVPPIHSVFSKLDVVLSNQIQEIK